MKTGFIQTMKMLVMTSYKASSRCDDAFSKIISFSVGGAMSTLQHFNACMWMMLMMTSLRHLYVVMMRSPKVSIFQSGGLCLLCRIFRRACCVPGCIYDGRSSDVLCREMQIMATNFRTKLPTMNWHLMRLTF